MNDKIVLNNKKFTAISNTENGETTSETIFHYREKGNIVWATYEGGKVLFGTLSGKRTGDQMIFTYQHQNLHGEFLTGKCESFINSDKGKILLIENWQWTSRDFSKGKSLLAEIDCDRD